MRRRAPSLALALVVVLLAAALSAPSCVAVIGADRETEQVVTELCGCLEMPPGIDFKFDDDCDVVIEGRLRNASPETRADWMKKYTSTCMQCMGSTLSCYRTEPTCSSADCDTENECCEGKTCKSINGSNICVPQ
jgi:hypothetical protein